jgi:RecA-family ATPase/5S rRNA maturation endonuclease (ribonuclease M5)
MRCPAHDDRNPSLTFERKADGWFQPHCHAGCPRDSVLIAAGVPVKDIAPDDGGTAPRSVRLRNATPSSADRAELRRFTDECARRLAGDNEPARQALAYVERRFGMLRDMAVTLGLGVDPGHEAVDRPDSFPYTGPPRLIVPFRDASGTVHAAQGRRIDGGTDKKVLSTRGSGWGKWGAFALDDADPVFVVAGPTDALAVQAATGEPVVFPRGEGLSPTDDVVNALRGRRVVVIGDNDPTGEKFATKWIEALRSVADPDPAWGLTRARPKTPHKDLAAWSESVGVEAFRDEWARMPVEPVPRIAPVPDQAEAAATDHGSGVVRMSDVEAERVSWLWEGRIPRGKLTILEGDPKLGKSTVALDLAARVSRGRTMPDGSPGVDVGGVVLLTAEDGLGDTVRPRLEAHGADCTRIVAFQDVPDYSDDGERIGARLPEIPTDVAKLEEIVVEERAALVVIDVLNAYLGGQVNNYRDQDVRRALTPLSKMAERTGAAVVVLRHLNKSRGGKALYAGQGSIGIAGASRSVLLVAQDPDDESELRRILAVTACNVAEPSPALAFRLSSDRDRGCAVVKWEGVTAHRADELVEHQDPEERLARDDACDFLEAFLVNGERESREVKKEAQTTGIKPRTLQRAREKLGVVVRPTAEVPRRTLWSLPSRATAPNEPLTESQSCQSPIYGTDGTTGTTETTDGVELLTRELGATVVDPGEEAS